MQKVRLQIIGTYLEDLELSLYQRKFSIWVENVINKINPITIMYNPDIDKQYFCNNLDDECAVLDIRKNLEQMLSHKLEKFESNVMISKPTKEVRYSNTSDYILVYNNYINCKLLQDNGVLYTYKTPVNELLKSIAGDEKSILDYTYLNEIDWKYYYDKFIRIILSEYKPDHIILLRTSVGPWYVSENGIEEFQEDFTEYRKLVEEMDNYFLKQTNCLCIDELYASVSDRYPNACISSVSLRSREVMDRIADILNELILQKKMNIQQRERNAKFVTNNKTLSEFYQDVKKRETFYLEEFLIVKDYINRGISSINDLIALYKFYSVWKEEYDFSDLFRNIVFQKECVVIIEAENFYKKNVEYLQEYPYISKHIEYKKEDNTAYFRLEHGYYLKITTNGKGTIELIRYKEERNYTFDEIKNNNFYCSLGYIEQLCSNLKFYIDRAREGYGNQPLKVRFSGIKEFMTSLFFIDWKNILESEYFIFEIDGIDGIECNQQEYKARTDLSFLFKGEVRIFHIRAGLTDQMRYYLSSKIITENSRFFPYYDDIYITKNKIFNGLELEKIIAENIQSRCFSSIFSPALIRNNFKGIASVNDLYDAGFCEVISICQTMYEFSKIQKGTRMLLLEGSEDMLKNIYGRVQYFNYLGGFGKKEFNKKYLKFPDFDTPQNIDLARDMCENDAVVIHIRRGDFVRYGYEVDIKHYQEALEKLKTMSEYYLKKFYIFSDDILWCRKHIDEFGFSIFPDSEIIFVDHNKYEESYRDMQLMFLGKVIIGGRSGFVKIVAYSSERVEKFIMVE